MNEGSSEQTRLILQRAEEIQANTALRLDSDSSTDQLLIAAEEAGLSRDAVVQALQEQRALESRKLESGGHVFALSSDERFYVATVKAVNGDLVDVTFLNGSDHVLQRRDIRPFSLLPGQSLAVQWPGWGWWVSKVITFDREQLKVRVSDNLGTELTVPLSEVRLNPDRPPTAARERLKLWAYMAASTLGGGAIGALIMRVILR